MTLLTKYSALLQKKTGTRLQRLEKALATPKSNLCGAEPSVRKEHEAVIREFQSEGLAVA
jgi:hypothetical protein